MRDFYFNFMNGEIMFYKGLDIWLRLGIRNLQVDFFYYNVRVFFIFNFDRKICSFSVVRIGDDILGVKLRIC